MEPVTRRCEGCDLPEASPSHSAGMCVCARGGQCHCRFMTDNKQADSVNESPELSTVSTERATETGSEMQPCHLCGAKPLILPQFALGESEVRQVGFAVSVNGKRKLCATGDEAKQEWMTSQNARADIATRTPEVEAAFHRGVNAAKEVIRGETIGDEDAGFYAGLFINAIARKCGFDRVPISQPENQDEESSGAERIAKQLAEEFRKRGQYDQ